MMKKPRGMAPSMGVKKPAQMEADTAMPDFKARALRPGGMKKGGAVKGYAKAMPKGKK